MNARMNTALLASFSAAALACTATSSLAQITYDRAIGPSDITFTQASASPNLSEGSYNIGVRTYTLNRTGNSIDLSQQVLISVNGVPVSALYRFIWVGPQQALCTVGGSTCSGSACWAASSCKRAMDGGCACFDYYDFVVPTPVPLHIGDVVSVELIAAPGSAGEVTTSNDTVDIAFRPSCPADFNGSGAVSVQDIFDFLSAYFAGNPAADVNHGGSISVQDIFDFFALYFAGCP